MFEGNAVQSFPNDFFSNVPPPKRKMHEQPLEVSLEQLFHGCKKRIKVTHGDRSSEIVKVEVQPGWKPGTKVIFEHVGISFRIVQKPHPYFVREGNDLIFNATVNSHAANKGLRITIPMMDNQGAVEVNTKKQSVIDGGSFLVVGRGMPIKGKLHGQRGNLIIRFRVNAPAA